MIFNKIQKESILIIFTNTINQNYVAELIHFDKITANNALYLTQFAARVSSFCELLERQFQLNLQNQRLELRTAKDFAQRLSVT